jgi:hypothetical protein
VSPEEFLGILESDDLFFAYSEKGNRNLGRQPRKRGAKGSTTGISEEKVAVIATCNAMETRISKSQRKVAIVKKI